jgi:hypothetical protein
MPGTADVFENDRPLAAQRRNSRGRRAATMRPGDGVSGDSGVSADSQGVVGQAFGLWRVENERSVSTLWSEGERRDSNPRPPGPQLDDSTCLSCPQASSGAPRVISGHLRFAQVGTTATASASPRASRPPCCRPHRSSPSRSSAGNASDLVALPRGAWATAAGVGSVWADPGSDTVIAAFDGLMRTNPADHVYASLLVGMTRDIIEYTRGGAQRGDPAPG